MFDLGNLQDAARFAFELMTAEERRRARRYRVYVLEWAAIAAGGSRVRAYAQIAGDHDFWLLALKPNNESGGTTVDLAIAKRPVFNRETMMRTAFADGMPPGFILPVPERVSHSQLIEAWVTNLDTVTPTSAFTISAHGIAVYRS